MNTRNSFRSRFLTIAAAITIAGPASAATGLQVGPSGSTYASSAVQCAVNPVTGMAPVVQAGLYNPKRNASATVSLNGAPVATVNFLNPDTDVWLANGANTVIVALNRKTADSYSFDATSSQVNICIPDTTNNSKDPSTDLETAVSGKSSATMTPGCALNPLTGRAQPFINLFDNGAYLLNVSANNVPLTQLNGTTRTRTPVFVGAGLNVISATNGTVSTDYFVRDGGDGSCTLP